MIIWRLCKARWRAAAFSGEGAAEFSGRWNSAGVRAVYCGQSRSLCALEVLAHVENKTDLTHAKFVAIPVTVPDALVHVPERWPQDWRKIPIPEATRRFGDRFLREGKLPAMQVPSVVVPGEFNFILNPAQAQFHRLSIGPAEPFRFDLRVV
jgi:RES domain-containing protein